MGTKLNLTVEQKRQMNENRGFPKVILECGGYRFVATTIVSHEIERTKDRWVVSLPNSTGFNVEIISESSTKDSLGKDRWTKCDMIGARTSFFQQSLISGLTIDSRTVKDSKTKASKNK